MEILVGVGAVQTVQKSSKSEPSSRFFGRLKIFAEKFAVRIAEGGNNGGCPGGAEAPPGRSVVGSIGSIIRSVRSIIVQPTSVDRSAYENSRLFVHIRVQVSETVFFASPLSLIQERT